MTRRELRDIEALLGNTPSPVSDCQGEFASFDTFCDAVEVLSGQDVDGDEERDGMSLETAFSAWKANFSPAEYAAGKRADPL